jgi:hypothetical protein
LLIALKNKNILRFYIKGHEKSCPFRRYSMMNYNHSYLVLLVQKIHRIFCYYNISNKTIKDFENIYGINSWDNSKTKLTLYYIDNNLPTEITSILTPRFNNNWYFELPEDDITAFVKLSKVTSDDRNIDILISNIITTPRDHISKDLDIYFIDINNPTAILDSNQFSKRSNTFSNNNSAVTSLFTYTDNVNDYNFFFENMKSLNLEDLNSSK